VPSAHEVLVHLVGRRVGEPDGKSRHDPAERAQEQQAEHGVLGDVRALAQHLVPGAEP